HRGVDDLTGALAKVTDDAPAILLAHEPDIFPEVPDRVALTLSDHTHGGQVRLFEWSPVVPSKYGNRYAYGHVNEGGRDLIVSRSVEGPIHRTNYVELRQRALRVAKRLEKHGIRLNDRVATLAWNTWRHLEAWYGITGIGAVYHTVNPRLFDDQILYIMNHA